jgi:hypothetical protein
MADEVGRFFSNLGSRKKWAVNGQRKEEERKQVILARRNVSGGGLLSVRNGRKVA